MVQKVAENPSIARVKYSGMFDYYGMLQLIHDWLVNYGYEFQEWQNKTKFPNPLGLEQEMKWGGWRKATNYCKYWITVYMHNFEIRDVEVVKNGKKQTLQQGRLLIEFGMFMELDWQNKFNTPFLKKIMNFYNRYIMYKKITSSWGDELYYTVYKLNRAVKEHLGMETKTDSSRYRY